MTCAASLAHLGDERLVLAEPARDQLGRARGRAPFAPTVATTISTPCSDRCRRSRSATSRTSPTPSPSTNVTPVSTRSTIRGPRSSSSTTRAVLGEHDRARRHTAVARELGVRREHPELAVDRHHGLRADEAEDRPDLLRVAVAGDVHRRDLLVQHLRAGLGQPVDRVVHAQLVPRHRLRGEDDRVAALDGHRGMVAVRDPRQRGHRLALASRAEDHRLVRRELLELRSGG